MGSVVVVVLTVQPIPTYFNIPLFQDAPLCDCEFTYRFQLRPQLSPFSTRRKTNLGNVIGQRKNSPRKSWTVPTFFKVRANKFALWRTGFTRYQIRIGASRATSTKTLFGLLATYFSYLKFLTNFVILY